MRIRNCGTKNKYDIDKCRCDLCTEAVRIYNQQRREARKEREPYFPIEPIWDLMPADMKKHHMKFYNASKETGVRLYLADRWCIKLGHHPWTVYGDLWFEQEWENPSE